MSRTKIILIVFILLSIYGIYRFFFAQLIYKPVFDASPIFSLNVSKVIDSVYDLPYEYVEEKSQYSPRDIKSIRSGVKEKVKMKYHNTIIYLTLFYNNNQAIERFKSHISLTPIYEETGSDYNMYYVTYIEQGRADQFGLYLPIKDYYYCYAGFLRQNLVITFNSQLSNKNDESLNEAIKYVGSVLEKNEI